MEVEGHLVRPGGVTIAYRITRAEAVGAQGAVLLLHGLASNLTRWSEFVDHSTLAQQHDLLRVDLRGHGESHTRGAIGLEVWCADLLALLEATGHRSAIVIGHSLGAQVALHLAAWAPQAVAALVLIDPVFSAALHGSWRWLARARPLLAGAALVVRGLNALGFRRRALPPLDLRALDVQARVALQSPQNTARFVRDYSSTRADLRHFRSAHYLQELAEMFREPPLRRDPQPPLLLLLSAGATFADPATTRAIAATLSTRLTVQTIDCQHWPLTEKPVEVREAIERWCATLRL